MTHRITTSGMRIKHRQNVELVNVAENHTSGKITIIIKS